MRAEEQVKELQVLQEENDRLRNEIKVLQEYKEKAHRELCRVRDEQKTFGKITYIIHSGFISGYQNRYGDNLKPPTNVYHRMTA